MYHYYPTDVLFIASANNSKRRLKTKTH